jgi:hypothetical protein
MVLLASFLFVFGISRCFPTSGSVWTCRECFLHEDEWEAASEAFDAALKEADSSAKAAVRAFVEATAAASAGWL